MRCEAASSANQHSLASNTLGLLLPGGCNGAALLVRPWRAPCGVGPRGRRRSKRHLRVPSPGAGANLCECIFTCASPGASIILMASTARRTSSCRSMSVGKKSLTCSTRSSRSVRYATSSPSGADRPEDAHACAEGLDQNTARSESETPTTKK